MVKSNQFFNKRGIIQFINEAKTSDVVTSWRI